MVFPPTPPTGGWDAKDMAGTIAAVAAAKKAGFPVYVIGMGPSKSIGNLNQLAEAGGTGSDYPVTSTSALEAALASVARMATETCSFKTTKPPSTPDRVYVYVDKHRVAKDESDGWRFHSAEHRPLWWSRGHRHPWERVLDPPPARSRAMALDD